MTKRLQILDFLRGIAILCVVLDHVFAWLQLGGSYDLVKQFTIFSVVPLFFLAGATYSLSYLKREPSLTTPLAYLNYWWKKSQKLVIAYVIGILVILVLTTKSLSLQEYWYQLITFPNQFYFISIYLQLLFLGPFLMKLWQKCTDWWPQISFALKIGIASAILLVIGLVLGQFPYFGQVIFTPARMLFGGIELFVFGIGTLSAYLYHKKQLPLLIKKKRLILFLGLAILCFLIAGGGANHIFAHPPNFYTLVYAASLLLIFTALGQFVSRVSCLKQVNSGLVYLGKHSLDIYIYHSFIIRELLLKVPQNWWIGGDIIKIICLTLLASGFSIMLTWIVDKILAFISYCFQSSKI